MTTPRCRPASPCVWASPFWSSVPSRGWKGVNAYERREYEKAAALLERADQCLAEDAPLGHLVDTKLALGTAYSEQGLSSAALEQFLDGRQQIRTRLGPLHPSSQVLTLRAGMEAIRLSRLPEAESLL